MKHFTFFFLIIFSVLLMTADSFGETKTATKSGNWNDTKTWGNTAVPISTDDIFINTGVNVTMNANFTLDAGHTLTINGTGKISFPKNSNNNLTINGTIIFPLGAISSITSGTGGNTSTSFVLGSGANLITANSNGITGTNCSIQAAGDGFTVTLNTVANYEFNGAIQSMTGLPSTVNNLTFSGSDTKTLAGNTTVNGNLTILSGATLTVVNGVNNYNLTLGGDFTNNGTFTCGTGTVTFNGTAAQNLGGTTSTAFYKLTVNKSGSNVKLGSNATVNNTLTLTNGILDITGQTLTIENGTTGAISIGSGGASNMILADDGTNQGTLKRKMTTNSANYVFPVGSTEKYTPMSLNFASGLGTSSYISANVYGTKHPNNTAGEPYINRYWEYTATGISSPNYSITITWDAADVAGTEASLVFAKYSSGSWNLVTGNLNAGTHTFVSNAGLTSFSSITGGHDGAMPVSLASLTSSTAGRNVNLKWTTISEINNSGFDIERKGFSGEFVKVGFVQGKGTVSTPSSYEFSDRNLISGKYSYRLKQIDNNGNFEYYSLNGDVVVGVPSKFDLSQNYPNPFNPSTKINFDMPKDGLVSLKIYDMLGREVATLVNEIRTAGYYTVDFNASSLSSGIYFYRINAGDFSSVKKMVIFK